MTEHIFKPTAFKDNFEGEGGFCDALWQCLTSNESYKLILNNYYKWQSYADMYNALGWDSSPKGLYFPVYYGDKTWAGFSSLKDVSKIDKHRFYIQLREKDNLKNILKKANLDPDLVYTTTSLADITMALTHLMNHFLEQKFSFKYDTENKRFTIGLQNHGGYMGEANPDYKIYFNWSFFAWLDEPCIIQLRDEATDSFVFNVGGTDLPDSMEIILQSEN